jgi:hypothetical protein
MIDTSSCGMAQAFFNSKCGYLPLVDSEIEKFTEDWKEISRKLKDKQGYWRRDTVCHLTGTLDDLMKFGLLGPSDPYNQCKIVPFKCFRNPREVDNKWEHWGTMDNFIKENKQRFNEIWDIYQIRNKHGAHTGRPLKENLLTLEKVKRVKDFLADALNSIREPFIEGDE